MNIVDLTTFTIPKLNLSNDDYVWIGIVLLSVFLLRSVWLWTPWKVQCWFCHAFSRVKWRSRNSWVCPKCEQYNGFDRDGDYNKPIEKMYDERKNNWFWSVRMQKHPTSNACAEMERPANGLCVDCNKLLEVKISMLARFSPTDERNCEKEMDNYRASLENIYRICPECEIIVRDRLSMLNEILGLTGTETSSLRRRTQNTLSTISSFVSPTVSGRSSVRSGSPKLPSKRGKFARILRAGSILVGLVISVLTWLSSLDMLRADSDNEEFVFLTRDLAPFNEWLTSFNRLAPLLTFLAILLRVLFYKYSRTMMLIDHICSVGWVLLFGSYLVPQLLTLNEEQEREMLVWQMLLSTVNCVTVFWTLLLPRKASSLKRRRSRRSMNSSASRSVTPSLSSATTSYTVDHLGGLASSINGSLLPTSSSNGSALPAATATNCLSDSNMYLESQLRSLSLGNNCLSEPTFGRVLSNAAQRHSVALSMRTSRQPLSVSSSMSTCTATLPSALQVGFSQDRSDSGNAWNNGPLNSRWPISEFQQSRVTDMVFTNSFGSRCSR
ncbi:transmembrane protein 201 [Trichuris trichiura]|uniref:Transmembrane protein 201 n=1 Tax=Trichuris trichiura TaxID=36087 RepID=A0A077ZC51_TRITR|nr:transmembrane protein 201 [Trichuris trichiura]